METSLKKLFNTFWLCSAPILKPEIFPIINQLTSWFISLFFLFPQAHPWMSHSGRYMLQIYSSSLSPLPADLKGLFEAIVRGKSHLYAQDMQDRGAENRPKSSDRSLPLQVLSFRKQANKEAKTRKMEKTNLRSHWFKQGWNLAELSEGSVLQKGEGGPWEG